jgi:hypothetical protein
MFFMTLRQKECFGLAGGNDKTKGKHEPAPPKSVERPLPDIFI